MLVRVMNVLLWRINLRNQQWSKVKKKLEGFICDSLKNRVQFIVTNYRKAPDQLGRAFITVDKKEVLNMCTITSFCHLNAFN